MANFNIHLHCLVLDGVYRSGTDGAMEFVEVPAPTDEAPQAVLHKIIVRMMKLPTRRGLLLEEEGTTSTVSAFSVCWFGRINGIEGATMRFPQLAALQRHGLVALESDWATDIPPIERRGIKCTYFRALLASGLFGKVTTRDFIAGVVVPVTSAARVPWWAIVPPVYRGTSNAFVSHAWYDWFVSDSPRGIAATLALELAREPDLCVWIDVFCLNQHTETTGLSPTLHATLRFAKVVYVTVSDYAMFDRSWCMYELASALMLKLSFRARVGLPGCSLEGYYSGNPSKAAAFDPVDKKAIDEAILAHFGDWDAIDRLLEHFTTRCSANFVVTDEQA